MTQDKANWLVSYPDDGNAVCYDLEDASFWYQHRNRCILSAVQSNGFGKEFYDIGGGNGVTAQVLQDNGYDVVLVEPYDTGIENAKKRGIRKTVHATLEDFLPGSVPVAGIGIFDVMEHVADDRAFLARIRRLLSADGKLILTVPAFQSLWSDNDVQLGHYRRYTLGHLDRLLAECGFRMQYGTYFFSLAWAPMWLTRVLPNKLGISRKNTPRKKQSEHLAGSKGAAALLRNLLAWEVGRIRKGRRIPFGTSCLVIAHKIGDCEE